MLEDVEKTLSEFKTIYPTDFIIMGGDWKMAPDEWEDRWPTKFDSHHFNHIIGDFMNNNHLIDIWRSLNSGVKQYSWFKPNNTCKSRIDYWLVDQSLKDCVDFQSPINGSLHCRN